jgi:hypothetical protein
MTGQEKDVEMLKTQGFEALHLDLSSSRSINHRRALYNDAG